MKSARTVLMIMCAFAAMLVGSCTSAVSGNGTATAHPNIVFVLTDDLSTNLVQYMPHVLAMEKAGTSFSNYYVTDSLCCPSRASIFTGEFPHDTGVYLNAGSDGGYAAYVAHGDNSKSFALTLQKAGYRTALMGKYLNQYDPTSNPPAPGWDDWDVAGRAYAEFKYTLNENGETQDYGSAPSDYLTDVLSQKAVGFIDSSVDAKKPFMLEVATFAPHSPFVPAPRYANADSSVQMPKTPAYNRKPTNPPSWLAPRTPLTAGAQRVLEHDYLQRVRSDLATDDLIARLEQELSKRGVADDTYFIFNSDNGLHLGEYQLHAGKMTAFDTDIRVPLVVTGPGVSAGRVDNHMVSNIDLAPTFIDIAGAKPPSTVDGVSALGLWHNDPPSAWQQAVLIEHHQSTYSKGDPDAQSADSGDPPSYEAVRTPTSLLVHYTTGEYEYYDTAKDPYELDNEPSQAPASLKQMLDALIGCHGAPACQRAAAA